MNDLPPYEDSVHEEIGPARKAHIKKTDKANDLPPWPEKPTPENWYLVQRDLIAALRARNARLCEVLTDAAEIWRYEGYKATAKFYEKVVEECKEPTC